MNFSDHFNRISVNNHPERIGPKFPRNYNCCDLIKYWYVESLEDLALGLGQFGQNVSILD